MSEVTTGSVSVSLLSLPLAAGAACIGGIYFAARYCIRQFERQIADIEKTIEGLKWMDERAVASPVEMAEEAKRLQQLVSRNSTFQRMTQHMTKEQKSIMSGVIATKKSPLQSYVPGLLKDFPENSKAFEMALNQGTRQLALDNFKFVNQVISKAAKATGFSLGTKILKSSDTVTDIVFTDRLNRRFTAYCKLDKKLNPSIALDLEGFDSGDNSCSEKMEEIIRYLQDNGVPFKCKRIRHNQPMGVLRKLLEKKDIANEQNKIEEYLREPLNITKPVKIINK